MKDLWCDLPVIGAALVMAIILSMTVPAPIWAEYYRYTDESGVVRFTEDLHDVPEAKRPRAKKVTSGESAAKDATPKETAAQDSAPKALDQKGIEGSDQAVESSERGAEAKGEQIKIDDLKQLEFEYLTRQKEALDREFEALIKEKEEITQKKETAEIDEYNEMVRQFNERISVYEEKREAFEAAANAFNNH